MVGNTKRGFTFIEILVVMSLIAILAGLLLVSIRSMSERTKVTQSTAIVAMARTALARSSADSGLAVVPAVHPLAATYAAASTESAFDVDSHRALFVRNDASKTLLTTAGEALRVDEFDWISNVSGAESRVIRDDDRFVGYRSAGDVPSLFGLKREVLGVISINAPWIDRVRQLPAPEGQYAERDVDGKLTGKLKKVDEDFTAAIYPDDQFLTTVYLGSRGLSGGEPYERQVKRAFSGALGPAAARISELGGVVESPAPKLADPADFQNDTEWYLTPDGSDRWDIRELESFELDPQHRVALKDTDFRNEIDIDPITGVGNVDNRSYLPRGSSLVDAYGNQLLFFLDVSGQPRIASPGEDGYFLVDPGENGIIDTVITGASSDFDPLQGTGLSGDDEWAIDDNVGGPARW